MVFSNVVFSAYCACQICCGSGASGETALGTIPKEGRTIAAPRSIPLGLSVIISGLPKVSGTYRVEDRTARRWDGKRWDIYFSSHKAAQKFGLRTGTVTIISTQKIK